MFSDQEIRQALAATGGDVRATAELLAMAPRLASDAFGDDSGRPEKLSRQSIYDSDDDEEDPYPIGLRRGLKGVYVPNDDGLPLEQMTPEEFYLKFTGNDGQWLAAETSRDYNLPRDEKTGFVPENLTMVLYRRGWKSPQYLGNKNTRATKLLGRPVRGPAFFLIKGNYPYEPYDDLPITVHQVERLLEESASEE